MKTGDYGPTKSGIFEIDYLQKLIRGIPSRSWPRGTAMPTAAAQMSWGL
jgi:hypothetical protein